MDIIFTVTVRTATFCLVEAIAVVAGTASNGRMQPKQGKRCQIVVESDYLPPGLLRMTLQAVVA